MGGVVKKVENGFFVKKWTFPQCRVHYVQYQYFLFYILLTWGVHSAYAPNAPLLPMGLTRNLAFCPQK